MTVYSTLLFVCLALSSSGYETPQSYAVFQRHNSYLHNLNRHAGEKLTHLESATTVGNIAFCLRNCFTDEFEETIYGMGKHWSEQKISTHRAIKLYSKLALMTSSVMLKEHGNVTELPESNDSLYSWSAYGTVSSADLTLNYYRIGNLNVTEGGFSLDETTSLFSPKGNITHLSSIQANFNKTDVADYRAVVQSLVNYRDHSDIAMVSDGQIQQDSHAQLTATSDLHFNVKTYTFIANTTASVTEVVSTKYDNNSDNIETTGDILQHVNITLIDGGLTMFSTTDAYESAVTYGDSHLLINKHLTNYTYSNGILLYGGDNVYLSYEDSFTCLSDLRDTNDGLMQLENFQYQSMGMVNFTAPPDTMNISISVQVLGTVTNVIHLPKSEYSISDKENIGVHGIINLTLPTNNSTPSLEEDCAILFTEESV